MIHFIRLIYFLVATISRPWLPGSKNPDHGPDHSGPAVRATMFKALGGGDKVQDADTFFKHFVEFLFDTKMPWFVRPIFHNLFGSLGEYDDDNTAPGYSDTLSRYHQFYQGRSVTRLNRNTRHLRTFDLPV